MTAVRASIVGVAVAATTFGALIGGPTVQLLVTACVALVVCTYIGFNHPTWLLWLLAVVIAALPAGYTPGVRIPLIFALTAAFLLATVIHPIRNRHLQALDWLTIILVLSAIPSVLATMTGIADMTEYAKWASAVLLIVALRRLPKEQLASFGRVFVAASTVSGLIGIAMITVDRTGLTFKLLSPLGYSPSSAGRFVFTDGQAVGRLSGTFIDPNAAGIGLLAALMISVLVFDGATRNAIAFFLFICIAATMSRAALFSVVVGVILLLVFHSTTSRMRGTLLGSLAIGTLILAAIPATRNRIFTSFGSGDAGSAARGDALMEYPEKMSGYWIFGHGWGIPEFKDPSLAFTINYVANAPLLAVYRGGLLVGTAFLALMLYCCYQAYLCIRNTRWQPAFFGGSFIGFFVVGMQLDFSTVTIAVSVTDLSLMIAFLGFARAWNGDSLTQMAQPRSLTTSRR